ncbi:TetR/AcrR family transcriptional regulator [Nocardia sp. bgisy134]|uniref:TetR/AcrR family transcriptional regulator n=1 Tax=Nocardia sp. bgisy134 TaxID=3413789 RepID=UPI003D761797
MSVEKKSSGVWQISPDPPARRRRRNAPRLPPAERRAQLLDAALRVVARGGLAQLTMQEVAKQAGVAKPVLYAMYPTAPELIGALLHREHVRGMAQVRAAMPDTVRGTGIQVRGGPRGADVELIGHVMLGFIETMGRLVLSDPERFPPEHLRATVRALGRTLPREK